jgi:hypothetical protein
MYAQVVTITPEGARIMLDGNTGNRPLSSATVDKYASAMKRGEWILNGEPIIIFEDGTVGNGQHRLHAVIKSGAPLQTLIVYGAKNEAFKTLDGGKPRRAPDILAINGNINVTCLASAARSYMIEYIYGRAQFEITSTQILDVVNNHPHINHWVVKQQNGKCKKVMPSAFAGIMAIASERHGIEKVDVFFNQVADGFGLCSTDPAYHLRDRFSKQTGTSNLSKQMQRAFMVKAVNAHITGKKIGLLRWREDEEMPKVV